MSAPLADSTQALDKPEQPFRALNLDLSDPRDRRFADYELLERIGGGGMGVVYRARQLSLDREVALKIYAYDPFALDDMLARFRSEARHAGRLQHPNIVPVYEIGTHENLHFFSMGLVRGPTLGQWLKERKRPLPELAGLMRTIAEAVEYAHQVGILHLDLKPGNVLIDERGAPQVGDFGLAHRITDAAEGRTLAAGTPAYMAPEQASRHARLSTRTDIWGLGAILFEMLTGGPPFSGRDSADTLQRLLHQPLEPPLARNPGVPPDLDAICRHCLARDPQDRYASARELADDLQRFVDGRPVSVRHAAWPERVRRWARREPRAAALTGGLALALVGGLAASLALWQRAESHRAIAQSTLFDARRQSALDAQTRGDALAAVPALVANITEAEATGSGVDTAADRLRLGTLLAQLPRHIGSIDGGGEGRSVAFAEDGQLLLASTRNGELAAFELDGRERWRITPPFPPTAWGNSFAGRMQAAPDGAHAILYPSGSSGIARPDVSTMYRVRLSDGEIDRLPVVADAHSYDADGHHALLHTTAGWQRWRVDPWQAAGPVFAQESRYCHLSTRGIAACAEQGFKRVVLIDTGDGRVLERFAFPTGEISAWLPSDDGAWLAVGATSGEILLVDLATLQTRTLNADDTVNDFAYAGTTLGVSGSRGSVRLLDLPSGRWLTRALASGGDRLNALVLDPVQQWVIGNDGRVAVWSLGAGEPVAPLAILRHRGALIGMHAVALHAPTGLIASFGSEGEIKLTRLPLHSAQAAPWLPGTGERPAAAVQVDGRIVVDGAQRHELPEPPYRIERSAGGTLVIAAGRALHLVRDGTLRSVELPGSAQTLRIHPGAEYALVSWIGAVGRLTLTWRVLDLANGSWHSPPITRPGLVDGVRFGADRFALWQGREFAAYGLDGSALGSFALDDGDLQILDATLSGDLALIATAARSRLQAATIEQWRLGKPSVRLQRVPTPSAHDRIFDLGEHWLGHGARVAIYANGTRRELVEFGSDWSEAAAVSPDGRLAAFATRSAVHIHALDTLSPLLAPVLVTLPREDRIAEMAFDQDALVVLSHFGVRQVISLRPDGRAIAELRSEALDALSPRDREPLPVARAGRDPGPPGAAPVVASAGPPTAPFNVPYRERFQGSHRGLGITDSAGWPRGKLRLRGIDVEFGAALQLAPAGTALGSAVFPQSAELMLPSGAQVHLFVGNQLSGEPAFALDFIDAGGSVIASRTASLPPSWDGPIHDAERAHLPLADVAWIARTSESRERGGGSPQLFIYHLAVDRPAQAVAVRLRAMRGAPLVLGLGQPGVGD